MLFEFIHKLFCKILVSFESLKFMYYCLVLIERITFDKAKMLLFIFYPYFLRVPSALVLETP